MTYVLRSKFTNRYAFVGMGMITWVTALEQGQRFLSRDDAEHCMWWNRYTWNEVEVVAVYQG